MYSSQFIYIFDFLFLCVYVCIIFKYSKGSFSLRFNRTHIDVFEMFRSTLFLFHHLDVSYNFQEMGLGCSHCSRSGLLVILTTTATTSDNTIGLCLTESHQSGNIITSNRGILLLKKVKINV